MPVENHVRPVRLLAVRAVRSEHPVFVAAASGIRAPGGQIVELGFGPFTFFQRRGRSRITLRSFGLLVART